MLEIIAMTVEDARRIECSGANRIELVSALTEGGLTPSLAMIESVSEAVAIPVNIMIRPHAKHFIYTDEEIEIMKKDIEFIKDVSRKRVQSGKSRLGVIFGVLNEQDEIDSVKLERLLEVCDDLEVTFHKAIDETDVLSSIKVLSTYPQITNVLTAGGKAPISQNIEVIKQMIAQAKHLNILLGGGVNHDNAFSLKAQTGATDFHFGTAVRKEKSVFSEISTEEIRKLLALNE